MKDWKGRHTAIVVAFCYVMYEWVMFGIAHKLFLSRELLESLRKIPTELWLWTLVWTLITAAIALFVILIAICVVGIVLDMMFGND